MKPTDPLVAITVLPMVGFDNVWYPVSTPFTGIDMKGSRIVLIPAQLVDDPAVHDEYMKRYKGAHPREPHT